MFVRVQEIAMLNRGNQGYCLIVIVLFMSIQSLIAQERSGNILSMTRNPLLFTVDPTANPDTICPGTSSQLSANPLGGTPPISYLWSPATGLDDPTSPTPTASPENSTYYTVTATDASMHVAFDSVEVAVKPPPETPGPISGPASVCKDSVYTYTIAEVYGSTSYSWTVPDGDSIISGQNTIQVKIKWSGLPGALSVIAGNACGNSNPSVLIISVEIPPEISGSILGPESSCTGENLNFSVEESPGATVYQWTVPADATIINGQGTRSIHVVWGISEGAVTVQAANFCGMSNPVDKEIMIDSLPGPAGPVEGKNSVCVNHAGYNYAVAAIPRADSYEWGVPDGADITDGKGTRQITVFFGPEAKTGMMHVYGINRCGQGDTAEMEIVVNSCYSIDESGTENSLLVYPNPSGNLISIVPPPGETIMSIEIFDPSGKRLLFKKPGPTAPDEKMIMNMKEFKRGMYFIHVQCDKHNYFRKISLF